METMNCTSWLAKVLADGECHLCDDVREKAKTEGYSRFVLKAARKNLGVKTFHMFDEDGETPNWFWYRED